ncbi:exported hypothetical protein [Streptomyces misionensis JCM 4497]
MRRLRRGVRGRHAAVLLVPALRPSLAGAAQRPGAGDHGCGGMRTAPPRRGRPHAR